LLGVNNLLASMWNKERCAKGVEGSKRQRGQKARTNCGGGKPGGQERKPRGGASGDARWLVPTWMTLGGLDRGKKTTAGLQLGDKKGVSG